MAHFKTFTIHLTKGMSDVLPDVFCWLTKDAKPLPEKKKYPYRTPLEAIGSSWTVVGSALMREAKDVQK